MISGTDLRTVDNLDNLYKNNSRYVSKGWGLGNFQWNYEYDILPNSSPVTIPSYIDRIVNDIDTNQNVFFRLHYTPRIYKISEHSFTKVPHIFREASAHLLNEIYERVPLFEDKEHFISRNYHKLSRVNSLYVRMIYKSTIPSQNIGIFMRLNENGKNFDFKYSSKIKDRVLKNKGALKLGFISLFSKGGMASKCPKCLATKTQLVDLCSYFNGSRFGLYFDIMRQTKAGKIYDSSSNQDEIEVSASDIFSLYNSFTGEKDMFEFDFITGAREVSFEVVFCHKIPDKLISKERPQCEILNENFECSFQILGFLETHTTGKKHYSSLEYAKSGSEIK